MKPSPFKQFFSQFFGPKESEEEIFIVSGLPRSGTSMMMKMLEAGGLQPLTDNLREADDDNPKGYYEFEPVKKLRQGEIDWVKDAYGKVVKVIATLLPYLPDSGRYRVVFVHRTLSEILASQKKMLLNRGEDPDKVSDEDMARIYQKHLVQVDKWMNEHANVQRIEVNYNQMLQNPLPEIERINQFFGNRLDKEKMASVIDAGLYRQRAEKKPVTS
jgi:hypothetical protein